MDGQSLFRRQANERVVKGKEWDVGGGKGHLMIEAVGRKPLKAETGMYGPGKKERKKKGKREEFKPVDES